MFSTALGGLFPASAREDVQNALTYRNGYPKPAVLDIGTGSGARSIDTANAFTNADVVGMDLVPVTASSIPPSNCRFEVGNADTDLALMYNAQSFNFIHARSMMQGVKDFHSFYQNVWRMLRPGGVFMTMDSRLTTWDEERQEIEYKEEGQSGFSWFRKTLYHMREALKARNPNMDLMDSLTDFIRDVGDDAWTKVDTFNLYFPVGNFDSPAKTAYMPSASLVSPGERLGGMLFTENMSRVPESIRPILLSGGLTPEEVDRLASELKVELKDPKVKQFARVEPSTPLSILIPTKGSQKLQAQGSSGTIPLKESALDLDELGKMYFMRSLFTQVMR
ncbi:hypothetical protein FRC00_004349 [Tulasnella sp. 408]|nr:hypothetical protein FRC00_004349 [Tulasnella sp. 408]